MVAYQNMENNQIYHIKIILVNFIFNVLLHHCVVNFKHINITIADQRPIYIRDSIDA